MLALDYQRDRFEVIVIDNASTDDTATVAASAGARCVREEKLGLSHARNRGIAEAKGEFIAFIDDDAWPEPDWLKELEQAFTDPSVACAGGRVIPAWKTLSGWPDWLHERLIGFFTVVDYPDYRKLSYPDYPAGTNMAFRKSILAEVGGFNAELGRSGASLQSGEETDLCLRIEQAGNSIVHTPDAVVHHHVHEGRLTREWVRERCHCQGVSSAIIEKKLFKKSAVTRKSLLYLLFTILSAPAGAILRLLGDEKRAFFCDCQSLLCKAYLKAMWLR